MKHPKYTPGPWTLEQFDTFTAIMAANEDECIALVADQTRDLELDSANAHLIAAAPDLLAVVESVLAVIHSTSETRVFDLISINKAIAKARGES